MQRITDSERYNDTMPCWSPDGSRIAFQSDRDGNQDVYVMEADGRHIVNLTQENYELDGYPCWSPDGSQIVFSSRRLPHLRRVEIYVMNADGSDQRRITFEEGFAFHPDWSPEGKKIVFDFHRTGNDPGNILMIDLADSSRVNLTQNEIDEYDPAWSPQGDRIVYQEWYPRDRRAGLVMLDLESMRRIPVTTEPSVWDSEPDWGR